MPLEPKKEVWLTEKVPILSSSGPLGGVAGLVRWG